MFLKLRSVDALAVRLYLDRRVRVPYQRWEAAMNFVFLVYVRMLFYLFADL